MRTIAVVNQKGGCGKTTTAVNLASCLSFLGARVLVVDLDPQGHAGLALGVDCEALDVSVYDALKGNLKLGEVIAPIGPLLDLAPSQINLTALEQELAGKPGRERVVRNAIETLTDTYDFTILDCAPGVSITSFAALNAATDVLIPVDTSIYARHGLERFVETLLFAERSFGTRLGVHILLTRFQGRTRMGRELERHLKERFGDLLLPVGIRNNVRLAAAAAAGRAIADFDKGSAGFKDYMRCVAALSDRTAETQTRPGWMTAPKLETTDNVAKLPTGTVKPTGMHATPKRPPAPSPPSLASVGPGPFQLRGSVCFVFDDAAARRVEIAGAFNEWEPEPLTRGPDGRWTFERRLPPGAHPYQFVIDGEWTHDPANARTRRNSFGGIDSVILV